MNNCKELEEDFKLVDAGKINAVEDETVPLAQAGEMHNHTVAGNCVLLPWKW